ncbi:hypothetical protein V2W30_35025 [Streptomyces sp. Q6]|uniref:Uncharacterized protein n=1 Tax=Streptomyces citrinus TaxID=3118173 RepID=A0ACD5ALA7_9ACTN
MRSSMGDGRADPRYCPRRVHQADRLRLADVPYALVREPRTAAAPRCA